jgi:hypothetical protein
MEYPDEELGQDVVLIERENTDAGSIDHNSTRK